jgi:hypothetical protein
MRRGQKGLYRVHPPGQRRRSFVTEEAAIAYAKRYANIVKANVWVIDLKAIRSDEDTDEPVTIGGYVAPDEAKP